MSISALLKGTHPLSREMRKYIATPWCQCNGAYKACTECKPSIKGRKAQGIQAHGGDLFQHSQWSALYLTMWYKEQKYKALHTLLIDIIKSDFLNDILSPTEENKFEFIQLCGFMHDIGKGGDQIYDMYKKGKYGRTSTDADHPGRCKEALLEPKERYAGLLKKTLDELLAQYADEKKALAILALCAAVHWNFGKLNMPLERGGWTPKQYLASIQTEKREIETTLKIKLVDPDQILIKLCMAIGCADVAASYNDELLSADPHLFEGIRIAPQTHLSSGAAWTNYKFNAKHKIYIKKVLNKTKKRKMRTQKKRYTRSFH
jgi:hypothetical protein